MWGGTGEAGGEEVGGDLGGGGGGGTEYYWGRRRRRRRGGRVRDGEGIGLRLTVVNGSIRR